MRIAEDVFRFTDSAHVYLIRTGGNTREAILIDAGAGDVLDHLDELGVDRITDVLMTHHHRDGAQGLPRLAEHGARIWVPPQERDLFDDVAQHWQARPLDNIYDLREDRFSLLDDVPVAGTVPEYGRRRFGGGDGVEVLTVPTPGHTAGSVSYLVERNGRTLAFTGDLIHAPGKVWTLSSSQWTYTGIEGLGATILSALDIADREPDALFPAHGDRIDDPRGAIDVLSARLQALIDMRSPEWRLADLRSRPYVEISRHLLRNRTSMANSYVLLSDTGNALVIDFGYDFTTGLPAGSDRSARRPWLQTVPALKRNFGVDRVEVAMPTHYHDDHVAGFNLLRDVEGTEVWAPDNMVRIFREPHRFDLPCLWWDPIGVDRAIPFDRPVRWHEYELRIHELPGHTLYAVAIEVDVDGRKVVATGDQQDGMWVAGERPEILNYQYRNGFRVDDFKRSAELYRRIQPDLFISGHWAPRPVTEDYIDELERAGDELARLHRALLPEDVDLGGGSYGFGAWIEPYQSTVVDGEGLPLEVRVRNPFDRPEVAVVALVGPSGWDLEPSTARLELGPSAVGCAEFVVRPPAGARTRRTRLAADITVGSVRFGQLAEALVSTGRR